MTQNAIVPLTMHTKSWLCRRCVRTLTRSHQSTVLQYSTRQAIVPAPEQRKSDTFLPIGAYPDTQPPSHKPPEFRRSQLHRQYTSLIKSTPLMLLFQHNNLTAPEWAGIRRELDLALKRADKEQAEMDKDHSLAGQIKLQVIKTGVFCAALRVAEYFDPHHPAHVQADDPSVGSSKTIPVIQQSGDPSISMHSLSRNAYKAAHGNERVHPLESFLNGPVAILTFPVMSTEHLRTALSILSPSKPRFPAPARRTSPGYYELPVQAGLPKLMLLGARIEGSIFDVDKTKWVGTISGGIDGLRAQLVTTLQGAGAAITTGLQTASRSLYFTLDTHKGILNDASGEKVEYKENLM